MLSKVLTLIAFLHISTIGSQVFNIGILDQDLLNYVQTAVYQNFSVTLVTLPDLTQISNYQLGVNTLARYDAIIGRYNLIVGTICQQLNLAYFFLGDFSYTLPGALLEVGGDLLNEAQMLMLYLTKYNINYPLRFISDSSLDATTFRYALDENTVLQCMFNPIDNASTINQCYKTIFQANVKSNYIFMTDSSTIYQLDTFLQQSLYVSMPYASMIYLPMTDVLSILTNYFYTGGTYLQLTPELPLTNLTGTLIQRRAMDAFSHIVASLTPYTKVNTTHWSFNNATFPFTQATILNLIKQKNNVYQPNGQLTQKTFYLYTIAGGIFSMVSTFTYKNAWTELKGRPNPATVGSKGYVTVLYISDPVFITEINTEAGIIIQGYAVETLNFLLTPIQLSYTPVPHTETPFVGRLVNKSFTGMLGKMLQNGAIMTAFPVPIIESYRNYLIYSDRIFDIQYSMLIRQANKTVQYLKLAQPYSPLVWVVILVSVIVLSAILWLTNMISSNISDDTDHLTVNTSIFMVFGSFLVAKMLVKPNMFSTQIFYLLIWLGTLLLIASYVANLTVNVAFANSTQISFTTFGALFNLKNYKWAFVNNSYLYNSIMLDIDNGTFSLYRRMYDYASLNWPAQFIVQPENVQMFALNNSDFGVLNDDIHNMMISLQDCTLTTLIDTTYKVSLAYVFNPSFQYLQDFSTQILTTRQNGIFDILNARYFQTGKCPTTIAVTPGINAFDYNDMCGVFLLIILGIILSFIVATIEYILKKCNLQCQRVVTGNSLQFGKVYKGKVKALDKNGVTVDIGRQSCFSRKNDARIYYIPKKYLGSKIKNRNTVEVPSPTEQGIMIGTTLSLKYLGNNPEDSKRRFIQV